MGNPLPANNGSEPPRSQLEHRVRFRKKSLRNAPGGTVRQHVCRQWYVAICERGSPYIVYYCGRGFHRLREHLQTHTCTRCSGAGAAAVHHPAARRDPPRIRDGEYRHTAPRRVHGESDRAALHLPFGSALARDRIRDRAHRAPLRGGAGPHQPLHPTSKVGAKS